MNRKQQQRQQKQIYKGIYISNERRKGNGGRIKCDAFSCKIQVNDFNPAIHQSQVEWVEIRRYRKGEKFDKKNKDFKKNQKVHQKNNKQQKDNKQQQSKYKQKKDENIKQQNKNIEIQDSNKNKINQTHSEPIIPLIEKKNIKQVKINIDSVKSDTTENIKNEQRDQLNEAFIQQSEKKQMIQQRDDDQQTQSLDDEQTQDRKNQQFSHQQSVKSDSILLKQLDSSKNSETAKSDLLDGEKKKQEDQEIIVARIIKQTKIIYKQKRFVGIMTCEKKKNAKSNFIEKDIKPMERITQDYYLDVTPIHGRLPKMQLDSLVKENIKILNDYIEKMHPEKGKQLTKKKLNQILDVIESIYIVASFNEWSGSRPYANIHQVIGKTMTIDGQCNCFLYEHSLNDFHYDDEATKKENKINQKVQLQIQPTELHKKYDKMVFSIDPASSVDLDDALSIQKVEGEQGVFQIGIHISDVSEYLKHIDRQELIKRTTSVYLPHKVYHMLTENLMKVSSLNPNVERLAFSIFLKMNLQGKIIGDSRIEKKIIKSRFKLSYETVQDIISTKTTYQNFKIKHPDTLQEQFEILVEKLQKLTLIGLAHRTMRIKFQIFENRQISFELDKERWPIQISVQSRYTSKKIVEEYMIIGNVQAAKHLIKNFKDNALVIYHPKPSDLAIKNFNQTFKFLQMKFEFEDIFMVQQKFLQIQNNSQISEPVKQYLFFKGRRMQQTAGYKLYHEAIQQISSKQSLNNQQILIKNVHFALGEDFYTHFTSPMRRMADVVVHETLNCLIYQTVPKPISRQQIQKINQGRKHTKRLKKDLTQMYICLMIHKTGNCILQQGIITSFGLKSVSIYIPYFDMMKQIIWRDELEIERVSKNRQNQNLLDVCIYYDRKFPSKDIYWKVKKYDTVKLIIDCTKRPPLRLAISLEVLTTKGRKEKIYACNPGF